MKTNDLVTILSMALGTAAATVLGFWSGPLEAGSDGPPLAAKIARPRLVASGVELTLTAAGGRIFKAGDEPEFELQAVNTTAAPATVTVRISMTSSAPPDRASRVILMPSVFWQQQECLTLKPHETKAVALTARKELPPNTVVSVTLQESGPAGSVVAAGNPAVRGGVFAQTGIVSLSFPTGTPVAQRVPGQAQPGLGLLQALNH
jgi:hypothetical protein